MIRGCVAKLKEHEREQCVKNDDTCKTCKTPDDGCNKRQHFAECAVTNGEIEIQLEPKSSERKTQICTDYNDNCLIFLPSQTTVVRNCFNEYVRENHLTANFLSEKYNASKYDVCSTPLCNNFKLEPSKCISCNSLSDNNCFDTTLASRKECPMEVHPSGCYHIQGNFVERGCLADLDEKKRKSCESDSNTCKHCIGNECNSKPLFQKCITTNKTEENDALMGYSDLSSHSKVCRKYSDACYIVAFNESVRRGCVSDLLESPFQANEPISDCSNDELCEECTNKDNCNNGKIENELCLVCTSETESLCKYYPEDLESQKCPLSLKTMGCYLSMDGSHVKRGCMSELDTKMRHDCRLDDGTCRSCMGNDCNKKKSFQMCTECDSRVDGASCISTPSKATGRTCPTYFGHCYTLIRNEDVIRNCTGDDNYPNPIDFTVENDFKLCSDRQNCNDAPIGNLTCISCDSTVDPDCAMDTYGATHRTETCTLSNRPPTCYHWIDINGHKRGKHSSESRVFIFLKTICPFLSFKVAHKI